MTCLGAHGVVGCPIGCLGAPWRGCPSDSVGCQCPDCPHDAKVPHGTTGSLWGVGGSPSCRGCPLLLTGPSGREGPPWHRGCPSDPALPSWYHGPIGRAGAETLLALCREGSFLVRDCETSPDDYSLSLR